MICLCLALFYVCFHVLAWVRSRLGSMVCWVAEAPFMGAVSQAKVASKKNMGSLQWVWVRRDKGIGQGVDLVEPCDHQNDLASFIHVFSLGFFWGLRVLPLP